MQAWEKKHFLLSETQKRPRWDRSLVLFAADRKYRRASPSGFVMGFAHGAYTEMGKLKRSRCILHRREIQPSSYQACWVSTTSAEAPASSLPSICRWLASVISVFLSAVRRTNDSPLTNRYFPRYSMRVLDDSLSPRLMAASANRASVMRLGEASKNTFAFGSDRYSPRNKTISSSRGLICCSLAATCASIVRSISAGCLVGDSSGSA